MLIKAKEHESQASISLSNKIVIENQLEKLKTVEN